jgi:broad specificity phosphatase PhoE
MGKAGGVTEPEVWLVRHGETEWSRDGRHTSRTDLDLTAPGVAQARALAPLLAGVRFDLVLASTRRRSQATAALLGFPDPVVDPDVAEWDYGSYEGRTSAEIQAEVPDWRIWTHPVPGGESGAEVAARADRVVARLGAEGGERALVVAHGHILRVLASRWLGQPAGFGIHLLLGTATLSVLGWDRGARVIDRWNMAAPDSATGPAAAGP